MLGNTVFVIGAGASVEFGQSMPVGAGLANSIRECMTAELANQRRGGETPIIDGLSYSGFHGQHAAAMQRIRDGIITKESIDDFVDEWRDMPFVPEVAKAAIAYCIASAEAGSSLAPLAPVNDGSPYPSYGLMTGASPDRAGILAQLRNTWLGCILRYSNMAASRRSLVESLQGTSFVTFNYDRCIEQYLWHHVTTALAIPPNEARELLQSVPIIHAFGSIGQLPEMGGHHPFGSHDARYIAGAAANIRTYTESVDSVIGDRIQSVVSSADKLVFLGFAFHSQNLELMIGNEKPKNAEVWGTCLGLRPRRREEVMSYFSKFSIGEPKLYSLTAAALLEEHRDDLF